jgi:hypothetical protein
MTRFAGTALLAAAIMVGVSANVGECKAASADMSKKPISQRTDISMRRHDRHYAHQPYYPAYYGRPTYYAPAPFVPIPPLFGYGWEWW